MEDKIFMKTRNDGIWEKNATLGFALYLILYVLVFFGSIFGFISIGIPTFVLVIWLIFISIFLIVKSVLTNQSKNMSKSTAFIEREGKLYAIQLLYTKKDLGTETNRKIIYMPSGTILQGSTLYNNINVGIDVQAHEKEVRDRRTIPASFSIGLDDILDYLNKNPKKYHIVANNKRTKLDNIFMYDIENTGLAYVETKNGKYNFLILNNPKIINENKKYFIMNFNNEKNEICTVKFSNCYDKLIEEVEKIN